jgi:hypothetical protein
MDKCTKCGSYAINPAHHGRGQGVDLELSVISMKKNSLN